MVNGILQLWRASWITEFCSQPNVWFSARGQRWDMHPALWCMVLCLVSNCKRMEGWWQSCKYMCFACSGTGPWHVTREFTQLLHTAKVTKCHREYSGISSTEILRSEKNNSGTSWSPLSLNLRYTEPGTNKHWIFTYIFTNCNAIDLYED
jgi:hypothetical protein